MPQLPCGIRLDCAFCSDISSKADRGRIPPLIHKLPPLVGLPGGQRVRLVSRPPFVSRGKSHFSPGDPETRCQDPFWGVTHLGSGQGEITMGRSLQNPKNNVLEQLSQAWLCTLTVGVLPVKDCTKYLLQHIVFRVLSLQTRFPVRGGNSLRSDLPIVISPWSGPFFSPPRPQICRFGVGPKI